MLRKALIISLFKQESWGQHVPIYRCRTFGNHHKRKPPFHFRKRGVNIRRFDRYQLTIKSSFLVHAGGQHAPFSPPYLNNSAHFQQFDHPIKQFKVDFYQDKFYFFNNEK